MGKPTASCFRIITCSDPVDVEASEESKGSSNKRRWSFRKRSARHRVLNNTVISETPSFDNSPETATVNLQTQPNTTFPEKTSAAPWTDEIAQLSTSVNSKVSDTGVATEDNTMHDANPDESVIVVIQASIRAFLAQREILKLKNIVKLQAAVRGHLVRRHAVGTLRCVQAIVKMQTLFRARRTRLSSERTCTEGKLDGNHEKDNHSSKLLEKGNSGTKPNVEYVSIEKLLSNKFAHQVLESTPRTKHIHIKCDPSKSDSAWKWFERWMSVSSMGVEQPQMPNSIMEQQEEDKVECSASQVDAGFSSEGCESTDLKTNITEETGFPSEGCDSTDLKANIREETGFPSEACESADLKANITEETGFPSEGCDSTDLKANIREETGFPSEACESADLKANIKEETGFPSEGCESTDLKANIREETGFPSEACESADLKANIMEETGFPSEACESADLKANITETVVSCTTEENLITCDADNFEFQACQPSSSSKSDNLEPQPGNSGISKSKENSEELIPNQTNQSDLISQMELKSISSMPEMDSEQTSHTVKMFAPEQVDTEGKKFVFGTRKAINPAFIAVQSKFEELSSTANSARSTSSYNQDVGAESNSDAISSATENAISTGEIGLGEDSVLHTSMIKVGGSECGTELSISSTLDSPDRSEIGAMEVEQEAELAEEGNSNPNSSKSLEIEANDEATISGSDLSFSISAQPEKLDDVDGVDGEPVNSVTAVDSLQEKKLETNASNVQIELASETGQQIYKSSPEASPKSHMTVPESHGTPSSQVSVKAERTKSHSGASNQKRRSLLTAKRSPSNPDHDSGGRSSLEQLPKDRKTGKRRNSFGSGRPDNVDQEPRDSNSSNPLPKYMQATESARAKALANSSPRSSPDMQDKDISIKKRHSLPSANEKHGSPRIHQSTSRAQQGAKGNGHPHERKWQR